MVTTRVSSGEAEQGHARAGGLRIDIDAALHLLDRLACLRSRIGGLVADGAELDRPLHFGDNWVGRLVAERLRGVAVDDDRGLVPVLSGFQQVLDDLAATVRLAVGVYRASDDEAVRALGRCER